MSGCSPDLYDAYLRVPHSKSLFLWLEKSVAEELLDLATHEHYVVGSICKAIQEEYGALDREINESLLCQILCSEIQSLVDNQDVDLKKDISIISKSIIECISPCFKARA